MSGAQQFPYKVGHPSEYPSALGAVFLFGAARMRGHIGEQVLPYIRPEVLPGEPEVILGYRVQRKRGKRRVTVTGSSQVYTGRVADDVAGIRGNEYVVQTLEVRFCFPGVQQEAGELRLCQKMSVGEGGFQQKGQAEVLRVRQADVRAAVAALVEVQLPESVFLFAAAVGVAVREVRFVIVVGFYP